MIDDYVSKLSFGFIIKRVEYGADSGCANQDITYEFKKLVRDYDLLTEPNLYLEDDGDPCVGVSKYVYITY
eukprot:Awhi_evm1s10949